MKKRAEKKNIWGMSEVPVIIQLEALECGAACLTMILAYFGRWVPLEQVRLDCGVSKNGSNAWNIVRAAQKYGLSAVGHRYNAEKLKDSADFPCVAYWRFNHFIVVKGIRNNKVYVNDPGGGAYTIPWDEFSESYSGVCLTFSKTESFEEGGNPRSTFSYITKYIKNNRRAIMLSAIVGFLSSLIGVATLSLSKTFMDELILGHYPFVVPVFLVIMSMFAACSTILYAISGINSYRLNGRVAISENADFIWKILNVPMNFFSQRMSGDIQSRQQEATSIANRLIKTFTPLAIKALMMIVYAVIMLKYSVTLTVVGVVCITICALISFYASKKKVDIARIMNRNRAMEMSILLSGISMCESIKAVGSEGVFFSRWAGSHSNFNYQKIENDRIEVNYETLVLIMSEITNYIVLLMGVHLIIHGKFTAGLVLAFQGYLSSFMEPAMGIVKASRSFQEMRTQLERVEDVMRYPSESVFAEDINDADAGKLTGKIELKNITFGYDPLGDPIIDDLSFSLEQGKSIAIVGKSGCGKSSVAKLIAGLYNPWNGEITYDGKHIGEIDKNVFFGSISYLDQDVILFEDSIANNIKMWDESIEDFEMIIAGRDAQIHDSIMERPEGYNYIIAEGGKDFSGGQRQLLEFARVLAGDPTVIIMDEATSALDAVTERKVADALRARNVSCIIISHRLSLVRTCDEIIVMDKGKIVDKGTHEELFERCSIYKNLVVNE